METLAKESSLRSEFLLGRRRNTATMRELESLGSGCFFCGLGKGSLKRLCKVYGVLYGLHKLRLGFMFCWECKGFYESSRTDYGCCKGFMQIMRMKMFGDVVRLGFVWF